MKRSIHLRFFVSLFLIASMFAPMTAVSAAAFDGGKKHFSAGMNYEVAEQWDKAVEEFALAVANSPKKGSSAAKEKDYESAYISFRRAYGFDPTNELAKSEMERMVRLQQAVNDGTEADKDKKADAGKVKMVPTGYVAPQTPAGVPVQQKLEKLRDLSFPTGIDLQQIIKELARDLDLNVLFDKESFRPATGPNSPGAKTFIDIKGVTAARALDYIFMTEGLFFQRVGPRTIIVFNQNGRQKYQQLVLRTFYLANAAPKEIVKIVQGAIPAQPGRSQTIILPDEATNSVTSRDTEENIRLIGQLIKSMDKDRAEVVMDVAFYEVNKTDFLQLGLQVGNAAQLTALGGTGAALIKLGGTVLNTVITGTPPVASTLPSAVPTGIVLPTATFGAFQTKGNTKLIASTQIHAFNNEDSSARIGQRVPVQSAQFVGLGTGSNLPNNNGFGQTANVINYEQVGLTLKFKPLVFPNQDVQVALDIELKDVAGANTLTPTFTERTIKGTARIQNNKTLLLASVAQGTETDTRGGIPFLSWIPLIGRFFSAPIKDNRNVDVVIAVTPRVIRAPAILPEDEVERATGSMATPTNSSLQDLVAEEDRQELLAAARRLPNSTTIQLPDATLAPEYVKASTDGTQANAATSADLTTPQALAAAIPNLKPIDNSAKTLQVNQTSDSVKPPEQPFDNAVKTLKIDPSPEDVQKPMAAEPKAAESVPKSEEPAESAVELRLGGNLTEMKAGEKVKIPVLVQGGGTFRTATMGLKFDSKKVAVRGVTFGDVYGAGLVNAAVTPFLNENGKMYVTLTGKDENGVVPAGTLAYVEIEALVDGKPEIVFDRDLFNFQSLEGKNFVVRFQ